jgi:hypothetical protein
VARSPAYFPRWLSQLISNLGDTLHNHRAEIRFVDKAICRADPVSALFQRLSLGQPQGLRYTTVVLQPDDADSSICRADPVSAWFCRLSLGQPQGLRYTTKLQSTSPIKRSVALTRCRPAARTTTGQVRESSLAP